MKRLGTLRSIRPLGLPAVCVLAVCGLAVCVLALSAPASSVAATAARHQDRRPGSVARAGRRGRASAGLPMYPPIGAAVDTAAPHAGGGYEIEVGGNCRPNEHGCQVQHHPYGSDPVQLLVLDRSTLMPVVDKGFAGSETGSVLALVISLKYSTGQYLEVLSALPGHPIDKGFRLAMEVVTNSPHALTIGTNGGWAGIGVPSNAQNAPVTGVLNLGEARQSGRLLGELRGYFQQSQTTGNYSFISGRYAAYDTEAPGSGPSADVMTIGPSSYTLTLPAGPGCVGGYAIVVVEATTLQELAPADDAVYPTNCPTDPGLGYVGLLQMHSELSNAVNVWPAQDGPVLVFMQSIGNPIAAGAQEQMFASYSGNDIAKLGGTAEVWNRSVAADSGYALAGSTAISADALPGAGPDIYAPEAATALTGQPASLQGLLRSDYDWHYLPVTGASVQTTLSQSLAAIVYGDSSPWPTGSTPGQLRVLQYISDGMRRSGGSRRFTPLEYSQGSSCYDPKTLDVRFEFCDLTRTFASVGSALEANKAVPSPCGCSQADWTAVRDDLIYEISLRSKVINYIQLLQGVYNSGSTCTVALVDLKKIAGEVMSAVKVSNSALVTGGFWDSLVSDSFNMISAISYSFPDYAAASNLLNDISAFGYLTGDGLGLAHSANSLAQAVDTTAQGLGPELQKLYCSAETGLGRFVDVIVSDYGKLTAAGTSPSFQLSLQTLNALQPKLELGAERFIFGHLMPVAYHSYALLVTGFNSAARTALTYRCATPPRGFTGHPWTNAATGGWTELSPYDPPDPLGNRQAAAIVLSDRPEFDRYNGPTHPDTPPQSLMQTITGSVANGGLGESPIWFFLHNFPQYAVACGTADQDHIYAPADTAPHRPSPAG